MGLISRFVTAAFLGLALTAAAPPTPPNQPNPIIFHSDLSPDEESAPTYSDATGRADFTLDRDTLRLSWKITFKDLSTPPTAVGIHGPQRVGVNGAVIYDLVPKGQAIKSPLVGSVVMSEGELQYLMERHLYVNILTQKYKEGELRGMIDRTPPDQLKK